MLINFQIEDIMSTHGTTLDKPAPAGTIRPLEQSDTPQASGREPSGRGRLLNEPPRPFVEEGVLHENSTTI